jgi:hypothetical protein
MAVAEGMDRFDPWSARPVHHFLGDVCSKLIESIQTGSITSIEIPLWLDFPMTSSGEGVYTGEHLLRFLQALSGFADSAPHGTIICLQKEALPRFDELGGEVEWSCWTLADLLARLQADSERRQKEGGNDLGSEP